MLLLNVEGAGLGKSALFVFTNENRQKMQLSSTKTTLSTAIIHFITILYYTILYCYLY